MTFKLNRSSKEPMSEINVTPFVDVMLVLLIIFMVTAPLLTVGVQVDLPESSADSLPEELEPLTLSINSKGEINMELTIGIGKGYIPSEDNIMPNSSVDTLSIDSIFNPVTNVNFEVNPVPGAKEPIEILKLNVTTDGSITAKDAISYSSTYLRDHLKFIEAISNPSVLEVSDGVSDETMALRKLLNLTIDEMELSVRSYNCLQAAGIKYIHELVSKEENQMLKYKNFGRKSLTELVEKLDSMGLGFGMEIDRIMAVEG